MFIFIDQSELPFRTYNCLKRYNIHTLLDLLSHSQEDLMKIENFRQRKIYAPVF
ncbi:DNA-directed RNA polymerase subunit alpha [Apostasia shenzhenica]|uniref:DNA-directed RNA polymerase subunit alpha n=1 Tax=Apostasia shenzhenica TaxID=1088818 RepID=A0A2I0ADU8_9ASPA|nr:DNA-directed RNA polymerase subunit alpha [Apostasia shenzhenica]